MWLSEDLYKIFNAERLNSQEKPENVWMPLLALYTGARREALIQLKISDFNEYEPNQWSLSFNEKYDKLGRERDIPLHSDLVDIGLIDYIHDVKSLNLSDTSIFPHIEDSKDGKSHTFGNRFSEEKTALGIVKGKCFHTLRTTLISVLDLNDCPPRAERAFVGHATGVGMDVHDKNYVKGIRGVERLAREVLPCLNYSIIGFNKINWKYTKGASIPYINSIIKPAKIVRQKSVKEKLEQRRLVQAKHALAKKNN